MQLLPKWKPLHIFGLDSPSTIRLIICLYIFYSVYLLGTCILLHHRRKHYLFQKMLIPVSNVAAVLQWMLMTMHVWRYFQIEPSCATTVIIRNHILYPLCIVFSLHGRGIHILFEVVWTRSLGVASLHGDFFATLKHDWKAPRKNDYYSWRRELRVRLQDPRVLAFLKYRGVYLILFSITGFHLLLAFVMQLFVYDSLWTFEAIEGFWLTYGGIIYSIFIYSILIWPVTIYYTADLKDAYYFRRDLQVGVSFTITFYSLYFIVRCYAFLDALKADMSAFFFMIAGWCALHTCTVTIPLIRSLNWEVDTEVSDVVADPVPCRKRVPPCDIMGYLGKERIPVILAHRPIPLEVVLGNPSLASLFEVYSKNAFVWDAVLFHQAVLSYRAFCKTSPERAFLEADRIYDQYIKPGAACEMNIPFAMVELIGNKIDSAISLSLPPPADLFDAAQRRVLDLVGNCSYRNFLYTLPLDVKARYLIPSTGHYLDEHAEENPTTKSNIKELIT